MGDITMTEEQLAKVASDAATAAAGQVKTEMTAEMNSRDAARTAENKISAGFATLKSSFPEMSAMITDEQKKDGAVADLDFGLKVAEADKARIEAADKLKKDADAVVPVLNPDGTPKETDESGNILAGYMGLELKEAK